MEILITIGEKQFIIPDSITNIFFVLIILTILAIIVNKKLEDANMNEAPSKFLNLVEILVEAVNGLVKDTMGPQNMRFAPYIFTLMGFLLIANLLGLIGLTPPTSDYSVTLTLALITFFATQISKFKSQKGLWGYLKSFTEPFVLLTPLNVIGELANPISLSFRLFGNVMSGGIIMTLLYGGLKYFAPIVTPFLHGYFDLFSGVLQTFIFGMLTMIFIGGATE